MGLKGLEGQERLGPHRPWKEIENTLLLQSPGRSALSQLLFALLAICLSVIVLFKLFAFC